MAAARASSSDSQAADEQQHQDAGPGEAATVTSIGSGRTTSRAAEVVVDRAQVVRVRRRGSTCRRSIARSAWSSGLVELGVDA